MASQHNFTDRLRAQLNECNARNLELQAQLAQRDDSLADCRARLQAILSPGNTGGDGHHGILRLQTELDQAKEDTANAQNQLSAAYSKFKESKDVWQQRVESLQRDVLARDEVLKDALVIMGNKQATAEADSIGSQKALQAQLVATQAELARTKKFAAGIQKQFEAEKRENSKLREFPASAAAKTPRSEIDPDDEEVVPEGMRIKNEAIYGSPEEQSARRIMPPPVTPRPVPYRFHPTSKMNKGSGSAPSSRKSKSRSKQPKRRRSSLEDDLDADYDDLEITMNDFGGSTSATSSRKRARAGSASTTEQKPRRSGGSLEIEHVKETFKFKAITSYDAEGLPSFYDSQTDLSDVCPQLWEEVQLVHEAWENACGECWQLDLEHKWKVSDLEKPGVNPPCISTKLLKIRGGKGTWHKGAEGRYACRGCAEDKRPCFTWDGEEVFLLPLHEEDRHWEVREDLEIRYWLDIE